MICVDASLVVKWLVPEEGSDAAMALFHVWRKNREILIAPSLIDYEVGTVLRQKVLRGLLRTDDLFPIVELYQKIGLQCYHLANFVSQAVPAAASLEQPTVYDVAYLLTAKQHDAIYVTADQRFHKAAARIYPFVKFYRALG